MAEPAVLQHRDWWTTNACYGCGPDNPRGLQIQTTLDDDGVGHCTWVAEQHHEGPPGAVNGGVVAIPMDCHGTWTAIAAYRRRAEEQGRDPTGIGCVTGTYTVRLSAPTPIGVPLQLTAVIDRLDGRKAFATVEMRHEDTVTASFEAVFFEVEFPTA